MARFYGKLRGSSEKTITRQGTESSGLLISCASRNGAIRCIAYVDENNIDCVTVQLSPRKGKGKYQILYDGPFDVSPENFGVAIQSKAAPSLY